MKSCGVPFNLPRITFFPVFCLLFLLWSERSSAQYSLDGFVLNAEDKTPIVGARVFLENTSIGAITSPNGSFHIFGVPAGHHTIIASAIGYSLWRQAYNFDSTNRDKIINITMVPKPVQIKEVRVYDRKKRIDTTAYIKELTILLLGVSANAEQTKILNPEVLSVSIDEDENGIEIVTASASKPLLIENKSLGYRLYYYLNDCGYTKQVSWFDGHTFFEEIQEQSQETMRRYKEMRRRAYFGSLRHFLRSLATESVWEEGFTIKKVSDVTGYFHNGADLVNTDVHEIMSTTASVETRILSISTDPALEVIYNRSFIDERIYEKLRRTAFARKKNNEQASLLIPKSPQTLFRTSGDFENSRAVRIVGYWGWLRLADELPSTYIPDNVSPIRR